MSGPRARGNSVALAAACVRIDNAQQARAAVERALRTECIQAAIAVARANGLGGDTAADLVHVDIRAAYLGLNPLDLHAGTRLKRLVDSLMENTADDRGVAGWPLDLRLAIRKSPAAPVDTVGFRCYALHDRFGELRVLERRPERVGTVATLAFSWLSSFFRR